MKPLLRSEGVQAFLGWLLAGPAFGVGEFVRDEPADLFLSTRDWGKGSVWINGVNIGRYWSRGPQHTLYVPAPVLRAGVPFRNALKVALAADTVSITVMEIVDNAVMVGVPGAMHAGLANWVFWAALAFAFAVALATAVAHREVTAKPRRAKRKGKGRRRGRYHDGGNSNLKVPNAKRGGTIVVISCKPIPDAWPNPP